MCRDGIIVDHRGCTSCLHRFSILRYSPTPGLVGAILINTVPAQKQITLRALLPVLPPPFFPFSAVVHAEITCVMLEAALANWLRRMLMLEHVPLFLFMVALCNRETIYIFILFLLLSFFFFFFLA